MMKACNAVAMMALVMLASGCSDPEYVMPVVNGDNCAKEAIAAMPQDKQAGFTDACKAWEEESSFRKNRFKKSSGKSYGPSDLRIDGNGGGMMMNTGNVIKIMVLLLASGCS